MQLTFKLRRDAAVPVSETNKLGRIVIFLVVAHFLITMNLLRIPIKTEITNETDTVKTTLLTNV